MAKAFVFRFDSGLRAWNIMIFDFALRCAVRQDLSVARPGMTAQATRVEHRRGSSDKPQMRGKH